MVVWLWGLVNRARVVTRGCLVVLTLKLPWGSWPGRATAALWVVGDVGFLELGVGQA